MSEGLQKREHISIGRAGGGGVDIKWNSPTRGLLILETISVGRSETVSYLKYLPDQLMVSIDVP